MKYSTTTIDSLEHLPWLDHDDLITTDQAIPMNTNPVQSGDPSRFTSATAHGSFELVDSSNDSVSNKSDDSFVTAFDDAQDAYVSAEEGTKYLKSVLGVQLNTTNATYLKTLVGDAHRVSKIDEECWIPVIRHHCMQGTTMPGPPTVGSGGRAGRNWRPQPGLYNANPNKKRLPITTDTMKQHKKKAKKTKPIKQAYECKERHYGFKVLPPEGDHIKRKQPFLLKELERITVKKFQTALNYWTTHLNFGNNIIPKMHWPSPGAAYDNSHYPNPKNKPNRFRTKKNNLKEQASVKRNHALTFACRALAEFHR